MVMGSWSEKCFFLEFMWVYWDLDLLGFLLGFLGVWDFFGFCSVFFSENSWKQRDGMGFDATFRWNRMKLIEDLMGHVQIHRETSWGYSGNVNHMI